MPRSEDYEGQPLPGRAEAWLAAHVAGYSVPGRLKKFGFGQSNPTFLLSAASGQYVLRQKPLGELLPKAHAIEREVRIIRALQPSTVPVPKVFALCEDPTILGSTFYIMEYVTGRIFYDQTLAELSKSERASIYDAMNSAVASLHGADPVSLGLSDYGRPDGFIERQVSLWTQQYRASEGSRIGAMDALIEWLPRNLPPEASGRLFHGDLRLDNMIFHSKEARVVALLDWELSTLGDPIADLAYNALVWRVPRDLFRGLSDLDLAAQGIPSEEDYLAAYCRRTGRKTILNWHFYLAFSLFRVASILQGVSKRAQTGQASAADAGEMGPKVAPLADIGWQIARTRHQDSAEKARA